MLNIILDFCKKCGKLLPEGLGNSKQNPRCPKCDASVALRGERIQGNFYPADAEAMKQVQ